MPVCGKKTGWLLSGLSTLFFLLSAEGAFRIWMPAPQVFAIRIDGLHGEGEYELSPNPVLIYEPKPGTGQFNASGYRGAEVPIARREGKRRLLFMGDSVIEGIRVRAGSRLTEHLAGRLGDDYEVVNLAVPGYDFRQEVEYLKTRGLNYRPDWVIFGLTSNDEDLNSGELETFSRAVSGRRDYRFFKTYYRARREFENVFLRSHVYRHMKYLFTPKGSERRPGDRFYEDVRYRLSESEIRFLLEEVAVLSKQYRFEPFFVFLPTRSGSVTERIARHVRLMDLRAWDMNEYVTRTFGAPFREELFFRGDPFHFNPEGHRITAELIHQHLEPFLSGDGPRPKSGG